MPKNQVRYWAVVPAAGSGRRFAGEKPKQWLPLLGKPIILHALSPFIKDTRIERIVIAVDALDNPELNAINHPKCELIKGGETRQQSVLNALIALQEKADENDWVFVHDAARPCLTASDVDLLIETCIDHPVGGILATPVKETIKRVGQNNVVTATLNRNHLWAALTPQLFRYRLLLDALNHANSKNHHVTDEAMACELVGKHPCVIEGRADNIKVTVKEDLTLAEFILREKICG